MKKILVRSLTGIVYIAAIVGAIYGGLNWFSLLLAVFLIPAAYELSKMIPGKGTSRPTQFFDIVIAEVILLLGLVTDYSTNILPAILVILLIVRFISQLYITRLAPNASLAHSALTWIYVALPLAILGWVYTVNPALVLGMFVMIWLNDTGAFCVGSLIGRHKLFERISPKKSWEGFVGGMVFSIAAGALYFYCFGESFSLDGIPMTLTSLLVMGGVVSVAATYGDLIESMLKRAAGVKDSGKLLPGHGGMLDRIDSLLLTAPALAAYILLIRPL